MIAIILAAGRGSRLGDLGNDLPKCLVSINGQSSLERYRRSFERAGGVDGVIVVGGYRSDLVRERLPSGFHLIDNQQYETTNSLHSLWLALESLGDEDIAVIHGDVVYEPDLLGRFLRSPRRTAVLVDELRAFDVREYHARVADGFIRDVSIRVPESESSGQDAQAFKVAGEHMAMLKAFVRQELQGGGANHYAGRALSVLIDKGLLQPVYTNSQIWSEFDTADDYRRSVDLVAGMDEKPPVFPSYGLDGVPRPVGGEAQPSVADHPGVRSPFHGVRRVVQFIVKRELPWRFRWVPEFLQGLRLSPWRALRFLRPVADGSLSIKGLRLQLYGPELLQAVMAESEELGIRPFLLWGTLLGCVRDGGFILNDHDVDMGLLDDDFRRVPELKRRMLARGYTVRLEGAGKISFQHPRIDGLWVDIDRLREMRDHLWSMNPNEDETVTFAYWFARESFASLTASTFEGVQVFVPSGAEDVLATIYGTWRIREERKRDWLRGPANLVLWQPSASRRWASANPDED